MGEHLRHRIGGRSELAPHLYVALMSGNKRLLALLSAVSKFTTRSGSQKC